MSGRNLLLNSRDLDHERGLDLLGPLHPAAYHRDELPTYADSLCHAGVHPAIKEGTAKNSRANLRVVFGNHLKTELYNPVVTVSREKTTPAPEKSNEAEWVQKIKDLGESIGAKQRRFAELVGVSQNMVSKWHKGSKPSGEYFARMAQIAQDHGEGKLASHFRRLAVESSPAMIELQNRESPMPPTPFEDIPHIGVPLLRDSAAAGVGRIVNESDIEDIIYLPRSLCPHPERTRAIRVIGDSMSPILEDGYIVAVDVTVVEPAKLYNHMVAAVGPDGGVTIKWLRKIDNEVLLIPQHTSLRHPPQLISRASGWRIVGSVCLWIGVPK